MTGVCIGLGEPISFLNGMVELESSLHLQKQSGGQSANSSIDNEDMMFHMDALSSGLVEKSSSQAKLGQLKPASQQQQQQKKVEKRIRYYVCNLCFLRNVSLPLSALYI